MQLRVCGTVCASGRHRFLVTEDKCLVVSGVLRDPAAATQDSGVSCQTYFLEQLTQFPIEALI